MTLGVFSKSDRGRGGCRLRSGLTERSNGIFCNFRASKLSIDVYELHKARQSKDSEALEIMKVSVGKGQWLRAALTSIFNAGLF